MPLGERADAPVQRPGDVTHAENQRGLVGLVQRLGEAGEHPESGVVVQVGLDALGEDLQPVHFRGALGCDGCGRAQLLVGDPLG